MALKKLKQETDGTYSCPACGRTLRRVEGSAMQVVDGQVDVESHKPRYECDSCAVFYREVLTSGYYDAFPLTGERRSPVKTKTSHASRKEKTAFSSAPAPLLPGENGMRFCPRCHHPLRAVKGDTIQVIDGKVDMENMKTKYECDSCGVFYREVLTSGYYLPYPQQEEDRIGALSASEEEIAEPEKKGKEVLPTRDLQPVQLKRDSEGKCACPRCGANMEYIEGGAVRLVDGRPYMDDVWDHFVCKKCASVFRRIVGTDYFQWSDK